MAVKYKRKLIIVGLLLAIVITFSCAFIGYMNYRFPKLGNFEILDIVENTKELYLDVSLSHNAVSYKAIVYNLSNEIIYETESENNQIILNNLYLDYQEEVRFKVYAFNKNGEKLRVSNDFIYTNFSYSFSEVNEHYIGLNKEYNVLFDGEVLENYFLEVYYEDLLLTRLSVTENSVLLTKELLESCHGRVSLKLLKEERVVDVFNLYVNSPIVGNLSITNRPVSSIIPWDDLELTFHGGTNATNLIVNLYNQENKIENSYQVSFQEGKIIIPATLFQENTSYILELVAVYKDYMEIAKTSQILIEVSEKETVSPVYINHDFNTIKRGTKVTLKSNTGDATIYYTLDGSDPTENSLIYQEPISINEDVLIKTKAVRKNMYDSVVNSYPFQIGEKELVVYLSPSNQGYNYGAFGSGYSTEKIMMNKLADSLEAYLKENHVKVYRNNPNTDINHWLSESNSIKSDLHLALHSNGSSSHEAHGIEAYVSGPSSKSLSIANVIYNNLYTIYPNKYEYSNRGVKYSGESLGEANDAFIPCGVLIEIAYHDYYLDARWIVDSLETIAKNIGDSILEFYQVR